MGNDVVVSCRGAHGLSPREGGFSGRHGTTDHPRHRGAAQTSSVRACCTVHPRTGQSCSRPGRWRSRSRMSAHPRAGLGGCASISTRGTVHPLARTPDGSGYICKVADGSSLQGARRSSFADWRASSARSVSDHPAWGGGSCTTWRTARSSVHPHAEGNAALGEFKHDLGWVIPRAGMDKTSETDKGA